MIIHPAIRTLLVAGAVALAFGSSACSNSNMSPAAQTNATPTSQAAHQPGGNPSSGPANGAGPAGSH